MEFTYIFLALLCLLLYLFLIKNYSYWKHQNIPCAPNPIPGIGHALPLLLVQNNLAMWMEDLYKKMGKYSMYGCYFMQTPALVIRDPDLVKSVLQTNFQSFRNNMITLNEDLDPIMSKNAFFARDEVWKESRIVFANNFSGKTLRCIFDITVQVCEKFMKFVDQHICSETEVAEFELRNLFQRITGELVANAAFGIEGQSFEISPDHRAFTNIAKKVFNTTKTKGIEQALRFSFPNLADKIGISLIPKDIDRYFRDCIKTVITSRIQNCEIKNDCLQFMVERMNEVDEDMALAQATSIFFDGYETSSSVLSFIIYQLAKHPLIQSKARDEVHSTLKKFNNQLTYESIKHMNYLEQIVHEAMRVNPALGDIIRVCNEKITLRGYDNLSCNLNPGDIVLISVNGLHMDEEFWTNPFIFDPDRFNTHNKIQRNKYTYLGFGEGPRMCIGKRMGMMTVKIVTALILQYYLLETSPRTKLPLKMDPNTFAWVAKGGLWVNFKPINKNYE